MGASAKDPESDAVRQAWRQLVKQRLPAAAHHRRWPVHLDHCFARILLDCACGRPWRECIKPPAWRNTPTELLKEAVALGEAVLAEEADLHSLNAYSLALRGKGRRTYKG